MHYLSAGSLVTSSPPPPPLSLPARIYASGVAGRRKTCTLIKEMETKCGRTALTPT